MEKPKKVKSPNWLDKNQFKEVLTIIDSNKLDHKNKIGDFKYIDIKDLVNNFNDNTISEIDAKRYLDELTKIRDVEIKHKRVISGQKELFNLFDDLSGINLSNKTLESQKSENYENENEDEYENKNEYGHKNESENEEDDDKTIDQNEIKGLNDILDEIIDKSKSFEEQIKSLIKRKDLEGFYPYNDFGDKELKSK